MLLEIQLRALAEFSARRLERLAPFHRMLRSAGTGDPELGGYIAADHAARRDRQRDNIRTIAARSRLRLDVEEAADTYSALANPDLYLVLIDKLGWTSERYRNWLVKRRRGCCSTTYIRSGGDGLIRTRRRRTPFGNRWQPTATVPDGYRGSTQPPRDRRCARPEVAIFAGKEGVDGSSPSEGFPRPPQHRTL
jgi:hypothetical protein